MTRSRHRARLSSGVAALLTAATVLTGCGSAQAGGSGTGGAAAAPARHGAANAITDVPGIRVGQYNRVGGGYATGTSVVWAPDGAVGSAYIGGGWPGTINSDVLQPGKKDQRLDAAVLSGGSFFGLEAYGGVMEWLRGHRHGLVVGPTPDQVDPLVAQAIVFDLARGGRFTAHPDQTFGTKAIEAARTGPVAQGNVGAGTGTISSAKQEVGPRLKGGVGTASTVLDGGVTVGAVAAVNAIGTPVDAGTCALRGTGQNVGNEFAGYRPPSEQDCAALNARTAAAGGAPPSSRSAPASHPNTTISVVATDAKLSREQAHELARTLNDGYTDVLRPFNSVDDGDSVFAMSTDKVAISDEQFRQLLAAARGLSGRVVAHAMLDATSTPFAPSYCDALPSACVK
ncbi:P1 family peptidase [Pseudonocardia phyllosphaerae]|uniref:P1 family peptidase n=1 Tax=Pseudonocardia phyllosphaerae TaxID=3390502 RepID=UPI00397CADEE